MTKHEIMKFQWKLETQITKVTNTNHLDMLSRLRQSLWQVRDKPVCVALVEFSPSQCTGKVGEKVCDKIHGLCREDINRKSPQHKSQKLATWFVLRTFVICVCNKFASMSENQR